MTEEEYFKETAYLQAEIEFKENFELEQEFNRKPAKIVQPDILKNYDIKHRDIPYRRNIEQGV